MIIDAIKSVIQNVRNKNIFRRFEHKMCSQFCADFAIIWILRIVDVIYLNYVIAIGPPIETNVFTVIFTRQKLVQLALNIIL